MPLKSKYFLTLEIVVCCFKLYIVQYSHKTPKNTTLESLNNKKTEHMKLGAFSISLNVKDIKTSKQFYENLGFTVLGGKMEQNYLIMKNENTLIGLFQGMFENNILTFNPGWDENAKNLENFEDIRKIQKELISNGITIEKKIAENTTGPASFIITDPDGNIILMDQHR
jgi:predicted enzyme related to lactoylglutathione lyase